MREAVAVSNRERARAEFEDVVRKQLFEVKRTFYEVLAAQAQAKITEENARNFEEVIRLNQVRVQEGYLAEGDLIRLRLEQARFESVLAATRLRVRDATIRLMTLLGQREFAQAITVAEEWPLQPVAPGFETLRQIALLHRPDLRAAEYEVARARHQVRFEYAQRVPTITPFAGYKRAGSDNTLTFGVSIPLPIVDRNQAAITRSLTAEKIAEAELQRLRNEIVAEVEAAYHIYQVAKQQVSRYEAELLEWADQSRAIALAAYQEGAAELIAFLDAQRASKEVLEGYTRVRFDLAVALLRLDLAVGKEVS